MLLPETKGEDAVTLADRLRRRVGDEPITIDDDGGRVRASISIGLACFPRDGRDGQSLLDRADQALYDGKRAGRDAVRSAGSDS